MRSSLARLCMKGCGWSLGSPPIRIRPTRRTCARKVSARRSSSSSLSHTSPSIAVGAAKIAAPVASEGPGLALGAAVRGRPLQTYSVPEGARAKRRKATSRRRVARCRRERLRNLVPDKTRNSSHGRAARCRSQRCVPRGEDRGRRPDASPQPGKASNAVPRRNRARRQGVHPERIVPGMSPGHRQRYAPAL